MQTLKELFNKYGSDKDSHGYTPYYDAVFKNIRDKPISLLEIGIGTMIPGVPSSMVGYALPGYKPGGSLRAWRDYFSQGLIFGMDIQPDTQFTDDRIATMLGDSTNFKSVAKALGDDNMTFDIIIDDGSHMDDHQMATLRNLFARLNPGGYYIIEDITAWNRIPRELREEVDRLVANTSCYYFSEKQDLLVISKSHC